MHDPNLDSTSITLLGRLRDQPADPKAWEDFVVRYRRPIYAFCLARSLQPADAEDVTQQVLARLRLKLRDFRYDPKRKFRAWLRTVSRHILSDFLAAQPRDGAIGDSKIGDMLERVEAREELAGQLEAEFDRELLDEAVRRVRVRVPDRHWDAFRLTMIEGLSGAEAAARLDMLVATVYTAKSKVKKLVREEIGRIEVEMDLVR